MDVSESCVRLTADAVKAGVRVLRAEDWSTVAAEGSAGKLGTIIDAGDETADLLENNVCRVKWDADTNLWANEVIATLAHAPQGSLSKEASLAAWAVKVKAEEASEEAKA
eukprot:TRINITY_DN112892_c0_g1_i1.p1 TRINITY_DN112892_c0_g1~~TRINITY_DN112892_c0_g1_i1.p1  ORF type:complete len:110 (+),score=19.84 TRINITY_DN112892_c0_g1_i1:119-448(+)